MKIKIILLFCASLMLSACVTTQADMDRVNMRLAALERQQQQERQTLEQQLAEYREHLELNLSSLEDKIDETGGPVQATQANLWAELESIRVQVATLSGNMDALERKVGRLEGDGQDLPSELDRMERKTRELDHLLQALASRMGIDLEKESEELLKAETADEAIEDVGTARVLYQRALDSFFEREYEAAQLLWEEFAENFPNHDLIANAYFWQGECFYQLQDYAQAVLAYQEVISSFPESNKLTASMLKQGMSFIHMDRNAAGKLVLSELIENHPDSPETKRAQAFMSEHEL